MTEEFVKCAPLDKVSGIALASPDAVTRIANAETDKPDGGELVAPIPADAPKLPDEFRGLGCPSENWPYTNATGAVLFYILRFDRPGRLKEIRPLTLWRDGDGALAWRLKAFPEPRPLYGLDILSAQPEAPVIVCEGEKATDAARLIFPEDVVVTSSGGANAAEKSDWTPLRGRPITIWPDHDEAGRKYAENVARKLTAAECDVKIIDVAALFDAVGEHCTEGVMRHASGWDAVDACAEWDDRDGLREAALARTKSIELGPAYLSYGPYQMRADGLWARNNSAKVNDAGLGSDEFIAGSFEVLGRSRNPDGGDWGIYLRWQDPDGRVHNRLISAGDLQGDPGTFCQSLASAGLRVNRKRRADLADYLIGIETSRRVTKVEKTGWSDIGGGQVFVLPNETIGPPTVETALLEGGASAPYKRSGRPEEWRNGVGLLTKGHKLAMLVISVCLTGPLLRMAGGEGGGVHIYGKSSSGKTTLLQAGASVWGPGATPGYVKGWRSTTNGLEATAALATDTALVLDEMGLLDPNEASAVAYALANGSGKQRAARDGSARPATTYRVAVLSSGEIPFEAKVREARGNPRPGQMIRLLDVPADRGLGHGVFDDAGDFADTGQLANAIKRAAGETYGVAGPEFVRRLVDDDVDEIDVQKAIADFVREVIPAGSDGQVERVARRFGLIAFAGELAILFGIVPLDAGQAKFAAAWGFRAWLENRGGVNSGEERAALAAVRQFLQQFGDSRFDLVEDADAKHVPNRVGWRIDDGDQRKWFIPPETWKSEVCKGQDPKFVARLLAARGFLSRIGDGYLSVRKIGQRNRRVYVINGDILDGDGDEA